MRKMVDYLVGTKESREKELKGMVVSGVVLGIIYWLVSKYPAGWLTWVLMIPSCLVILMTALARVNDMTIAHTSWKWQLRKLGFIIAGTASVAYLSLPFGDFPRFPQWAAVMLSYGVSFSWITTPNMIPWHRYVSGEFRKKDLVQMAAGEKPGEEMNVPTK